MVYVGALDESKENVQERYEAGDPMKPGFQLRWIEEICIYYRFFTLQATVDPLCRVSNKVEDTFRSRRNVDLVLDSGHFLKNGMSSFVPEPSGFLVGLFFCNCPFQDIAAALSLENCSVLSSSECDVL